MRVCIVTVSAHGIGGMQDHTRGLAAGLAAAGHEVDVVADRHPEGVPSEERDGARWHYLPVPSAQARSPRRNPAWLSASYQEFQRLHALHAFELVHSESTSAIELVHHGVHREIPLVAKFHGNAIALARAAIRRFRAGDRPRRIAEAKGMVWLLGQNFQHGQWHRFRPCHWMVPSQSELEDTRRDAFLKRELGHVVPNGIDSSRFRPRDRIDERDALETGDEPLFVCVGRLDPQKGMHHAIAALAAIGENGRRARLVVLGEGSERASLERLAQSLGVADRVELPGARPHEEVARYLAAADAFLFPTERAEAAPLVLPQAMACGTAVIASDIDPVAEVVQGSEDSGLLVPAGDAAALARAMRQLLEDEPLRRRLGAAGRRRVLDEYTLERMLERTLAVYELALVDGPAGRKRKPR